jgi:PAS domain S-box-containing protein
MFAVDRHHRIILWNQAAESLTGYSAQEVVGQYCHDVFQGRDSKGVLICNNQCSHFETAGSLRWLPNENLCARSKSGEDVWINVTTVSLLSQRGRLSSLAHFFRNADGNGSVPEGHRKLSGPVAQFLSKPASPTESRMPKEGRTSPSVPLTNREHSILRLLVEGLSTRAIGERLCISPVTVKNHVQSILRKLQVHSRVQAIALALRQGLL